jgi:hypothetical protein
LKSLNSRARPRRQSQIRQLARIVKFVEQLLGAISFILDVHETPLGD